MSQIKECFESRYGEDGVIMEADFSQLEVIGLAFISGDKQLKKDIEDGLDSHCLNASLLYNEDYSFIKSRVDAGDKEWIKKRKMSKAPGFLIIYGGGAMAMAKATGLPQAQCQEFIDNYYSRYWRVKEWQDEVIQDVRDSRVMTTKRTAAGFPAGQGEYISITGRKYVFTEYDAPDWMMEKTSFSPTQMKNYGIQGFSTGDLVPLALGKLYRKIKERFNEEVKLINTIHDSVLLDCPVTCYKEVAQVVKEVLEDTPAYFEEIYGIEFPLELKVDVEVGETWATKASIK